MPASYSPEDNKLRLYVGRVPREDYERLRAAGFTSTPKQDCDFVATWTPGREDIAREFLDDDEDIDDEDYSPEERAADRAERFSGYRDKRAGEAGASADAFDSGPSAFGHQNRARAERQAARHDRKRVYAVSQWSKAEYWQERTAGVIANALHRSDARTRRGRILTLEADQRKHAKSIEECQERYDGWAMVVTMAGADELLPIDAEGYAIIGDMNEAQRYAYRLANSGSFVHLYHPTSEEANEEARRIWKHGFSAYDFLTNTDFIRKPFERLTPRQYAELYAAKIENPSTQDYVIRWAQHFEMRLSYERAMLANEGGSAASADMEPGGWIRGGRRSTGEWRQIQRVNKSPATGRVTSVKVWGTVAGYTKESGYKEYATTPALVTMNVERLGEDAYRAPTDEERAAFQSEKKAAKKATPTIPTINPTDEDAQRLQDYLNRLAADAARAKSRTPSEPRAVERVTQALYSRLSGRDGMFHLETYTIGETTCKVRTRRRGFSDYNAADSVIVLTDKPQKPLPINWETVADVLATPESVNA